MIPYLFLIILCAFSLYSWVLVDPNFTLLTSPYWTTFRNSVIQLGYFHRDISWILYLSLCVILYILYWYIIQSPRQFSLRFIWILGLISLASYPFLSHDLFNYMFDARIITLYHSNPYLHAARDFRSDDWLRFMQWVHRPYPYGPTFLPLTLLPSLLSKGTLFLNFFLFKLSWVGMYIYTTYRLHRRSEYLARLFAYNPFVIVEGLLNTHNDFIAICFISIALLMLESSRSRARSWVMALISVGIKYLTAPYLLYLLPQRYLNKNSRTIGTAIGLIIMLTILISRGEIQSWYLLNFVPLFLIKPEWMKKTIPLQFGFLFSYYPFVAFGRWHTLGQIDDKLVIMVAGFVITGLLWKSGTSDNQRTHFSKDESLFEMEHSEDQT